MVVMQIILQQKGVMKTQTKERLSSLTDNIIIPRIL